MRKQSSLLLVLAFCFALVFLSFEAVQVSADPGSSWSKTFGGESDERAFSVQQTTDGGYIFVGFTESFGSGSSDAWLIKTDSSGNEEWSNTFGGSEWDEVESVQQTPDGGYILAGMTGPVEAGYADAWLIKTDSSGNEEWSKTFGGSEWDRTLSVQQTPDGGYILAGPTESFGAGSSDAWLIKTDNSGNEEWSKTFGGSYYDSTCSVQQTNDGGYILGGLTHSFGAGSSDAWLIKTDSLGSEEWNRTFGGSGGDRTYSIQQTSDEGYILAGMAGPLGGYVGAWLIKTDSSGNEEWSKTFGGSGNDYAHFVQQTSDGGYILAGATASFGAGGYDFWLIKTDSLGNGEGPPSNGDTNGGDGGGIPITYVAVGAVVGVVVVLALVFKRSRG